MECTYDGGDCCGPNVNTQYCTECSCIDPNGGHGALSTTTALAVVKTRFFDFDPAILHDYNIWALLGALQGIINH